MALVIGFQLLFLHGICTLYILILGFTIVVDYYAGIFIEKASGRKRKLFLVCSLVANIGVLAVFKYYNFINENISVLCQSLGVTNNIPYLSILLPIGLSFHTFQAMSYTIEVYRGNQKAERHFGIYSLYVMFYPQLVAGPIERPQNVLHQFHEYHKFDYSKFVAGCKLILWGFFMKVVVADRLSIYVDAIYNHPADHNGSSLLLATFFFAIQIYCDFAGYSTIALGCAKVMGFELMENFHRPYLATSPPPSGEDGIYPCQPGFRTTSISPWAAVASPYPGTALTSLLHSWSADFGMVPVGPLLYGEPSMACTWWVNGLSL
nr:hypothetical protein [Paraflavitalea speifideiaquila]